ncbi:MAG: hypothetical protein ACI4WG_03490 [Erysipelotrichaceae bacterium]
MKWKDLRISSFTTGWWLYVFVQLLAIIAIKIAVIKARRFLILFSLFTLIYLLVYKYLLVTTSNGRLVFANELPLYLCNLNIIYGLLGTIFDNQVLLGFCYSIGLTGAILALVMPEKYFIDIPFFSLRAFGFYGYHSLLVIFDMSLVTTGYFIPQYHLVYNIMLLACFSLIAVHIVNVIFSKTIHPLANYSFTMYPINPILEKMYQIIPVKCLYLFPLIPVFAVIYLLLTFLII